MSHTSPIRRRAKPSEEGYLLLSVMFLLAILALWLAVAVPKMTQSIQRDRDLETMERGKQYIRAVQLYYRKFGAYPPSADALVKTNDIRFLRKKYIDPTTGKDDWKPIMFGQNKVPTAMGFFGQPLSTGGSIAGIGPSGGNGLNGANGSGGGLFNSNGGSGFGGAPGSSIGGFGNSSGSFGSPTGSSFSDSSDNGSNTTASSGSSDNSGNATGSGTSGASGTNGSGTNGSSPGGAGLTGQTFGGAGIIGFSPASPKQSILIYKKKDHYNEWEFTYDPIMDMKMMSGGNTGMIGQPASNMNGQAGLPGLTPLGPGTGTSNTPNNGPGSTPEMPPDTSAPQQQQ
jgi:type II secretory pathway pseudopilin PulG